MTTLLDQIKPRKAELLQRVLDHYRLEVNSTGHFKLRPDERTPSCHIRPDGVGVHDFGSGFSGDALDLIAYQEGLDPDFEAARVHEIAASLLGLNGSHPSPSQPTGARKAARRQQPAPKPPDVPEVDREVSCLEIGRQYGLRWSDFTARGVRPTKAFFGELKSHPTENREQQALLYPIRVHGRPDPVLKLKSLRRVNGKRVGRGLKAMSGFQTGFFDCGLDNCAGRPLVLTEGEEKAIAAAKAGFPAVSLANGSLSLCDKHILLIRDAGPSEVIIAFDNDEGGMEGVAKCLREFAQTHVACRVVDWPAGTPLKHDLTDVLLKSGAGALNALLNEAIAPEEWLARHHPEDPPPATPASATVVQEIWPPITPFQGEVPELNPECLTALDIEMRDILVTLSECSQIPIDGIVPMAIAAVASCAMSGYKVKPYWFAPETPVIYHLLVAPPGAGKTVAYNFIKKPAEAHANDLERWASNRHADTCAEAAMLEAAKKKALKAASDGDAQALDEMKRVNRKLSDLILLEPKRFITTDSTEQALSIIMATNEGRAAIITDEAGAFDGILNVYTDKRNVGDVYNKGWTGGTVSISRVGRKDIHVPEARLVISVCIQPKVLVAMLEANPQLAHSGFLSRCMISYIDRPPSSFESDLRKLPPMPSRFQEIWTTRLLNIAQYYHQFSSPLIQSYSEECLDYFAALTEDINRRRDPGMELEHADSVLARPGHHASRIAALLHLLANGPGAHETPVSGNTGRCATMIARHSAESWGVLLAARGPSTNLPRRVANTLANKGAMTKRDLLREMTTVRANQLNEALDTLEALNMVRIDEEKQPKGFPKILITPHPQLRQYLRKETPE